MKTASAVVTIVTTMAIDGQWAVAAAVVACTGDVFVAFASTK
jgi:hypothetical protein